MELKFNPQETNVQSTQAVYTQYKKWLAQNGVTCDPRVRYPSYFGEKGKGVVGVSASKPIEKSKAVIAVPYNLLITMDKVLSVKILEQIINQNPDVFGVSEHAVMKMLILYVCHELLKGKESFYFPYFEICKDSYLEKWTHWEMVALQNPQLMRSLKREKQEIEMFFLQFLRLFTKYENVFPSGKGNMFYQKLFERAYTFVTTRAFGWSLPSISLIPMADSLNHGNNYLNHFLVDINEQKNPSQTYHRYKQKSNLSILKEEHLIQSENQLNEVRKKKKRRYQKFVDKHKQIITSSKEIGDLSSGSKVQNSQRNKQYFILSEQYKSEMRNLRQLHFYESSCSQDNDTDEDELTEFTMKRQQFEFDEKYSVNNKNGKKGIINKYWKLWTDNSLEDNEDQESQDEQQQGKESKKEDSSKMKQSLENYNQKHKQSEGSSSVSSTESEEDDENFDWMKPHSKEDFKSCYFVMQTKSIVKENQQLHNFYGRRTNRFLLQSYNFVMVNNQYDSVAFRLYADPTLNVKPNAVQKLVFFHTKKQSTQKSIKLGITKEVRLKPKRINQQLINHCRCYTLQFDKKQFTNPVSVTLPFDRQIQLKTLKLYKEIIQALKGQYMTEQQDDEELLEKTVQHEMRTAIQYRMIQKQILSSQLELIDKCIEFLTKRWKGGRIQKATWKDFKELVKFRSYVLSLERGKIQ